MTLAFSLDKLLGPPAVDPPLQGAQFFQCGLMRRLQLFVGGGRLVQHTAQFGRPLECSQQELLALGKIGGKSVSVVHNARNPTNASRLGKSSAARIHNAATIPAPTAAAAAQIEAAQ